MKVSINWIDSGRTIADVTVRPGWLARLFGAVGFTDQARLYRFGLSTHDRNAAKRDSAGRIRYEVRWVWDSPFGGPIEDERIVRRLYEERARGEVADKIADTVHATLRGQHDQARREAQLHDQTEHRKRSQ